MEKLTNVNLDMSFFSCMSLLTQLLGNNLNLKGTFNVNMGFFTTFHTKIK